MQPRNVPRTLPLPDELRGQRSSRPPELGARLLFFSGGSALRPLCRVLKQFTHNSVHLVTAFDSGGSSAQLRRAFAMPAIGDLRNRVVALADETVRDNPQIYRLFAYRMSSTAARSELAAELARLTSGEHPLAASIPEPVRRIAQTHLSIFAQQMPDDFDLRGANIGNLMLAGGFLSQSRDLESVLCLFSKLLEVRGVVRPIVDVDLHLCAELADGTRVIGQHRLTGKQAAPISSAVKDLFLIRSLNQPERTTTPIGEKARHSIETADLICFPMGSFYSSVVANLLPSGVGRAITRAGCPRVYIPNTARDSEQYGLTLADSVERLVHFVRSDAGIDVPISRIVNLVLLDGRRENYAMEADVERIERMGVRVVERDLVSADSRPHADPRRLAEALLSLT